MTHLQPSSSAPAMSAMAALQAQQSGPASSQAAPVVLSTTYRASLISLIIRMCSIGTYANVTNFEWYSDTLVELTYLAMPLHDAQGQSTINLGCIIRDQLVDVAARVKAIRPYMVTKMAAVLGDETFLDNGDGTQISEVLGAAAWICGEYCPALEDPRPVIASLFGSNTTASLPPRILALYVHNGVKIYASWLASLAADWDESHFEQIVSVTSALEARLAIYAARSDDIDLQERSAELQQLLGLVRKGLDAPRPLAVEPAAEGFGGEVAQSIDDSGGFSTASTSSLPPASLSLLGPTFFSHELNPVNPKAQSMVQLPVGLNLDLVMIPRSSRRNQELSLSDDEDVDDFGRPRGKVKGRGDVDVVAFDGSIKPKKVKVGGKKVKARRADENPAEIAKVSYSLQYNVHEHDTNLI